MTGKPYRTDATVVSAATWPGSSISTRKMPNKDQDRTQFRCQPLYVDVNTYSANWEPQVLETPVRSQMKFSSLSIVMTTPARKTQEYMRGAKGFSVVPMPGKEAR
jgi:hypothetical protein